MTSCISVPSQSPGALEEKGVTTVSVSLGHNYRMFCCACTSYMCNVYISCWIPSAYTCTCIYNGLPLIHTCVIMLLLCRASRTDWVHVHVLVGLYFPADLSKLYTCTCRHSCTCTCTCVCTNWVWVYQPIHSRCSAIVNFIKFHVHIAKEGQEQEEAIVSLFNLTLCSIYVHASTCT